MTSRDEYYDLIDAIDSECPDIRQSLQYIYNIANNIKNIKKSPDLFSVEKFMGLDNESKITFLKYTIKNLYLNEFLNLITYYESAMCSEVINDYLLLLIFSISKNTKCDQKLVCQIIELLIELGCDVSYNNHLATILASCSHNIILQIILSHGGNACVADNMPIRHAVRTNENLNNITILVKHGANIHTHNNYIFRYSVYQNSFNVIKYCIDIGVDVNINNGIAIKYSIYNSSKMFDVLINHGADINYIDGNDIFNLVQSKNFYLLKKISDSGVRIDQMNSVCDIMNKDNDNNYTIFQFLKNNGIPDKNIIFALEYRDD
ncbi:ankyrin repeat protein [Bandra megavirus]|uniref:Ankyrin repeat protein n=1 Tax=Bandra megavirus TaxID=2071566 RepID=A0A2K9V8X6_9VIRU|nr:ankyrin repeat protein [Bandra megavirus]